VFQKVQVLSLKCLESVQDDINSSISPPGT
jgi:hypothetical protein